MAGDLLNNCSLYLLFFTIVSTFVLLCCHYWPAKQLTRKSDELMKYYDFIIVGAGTAGSTLAERLTRSGKFHVLLLEAGNDEAHSPSFDIPLMAVDQQMTTADWQYKTESQLNACGSLVNNQSSWPRGKVVGGTSNLNFMTYNRGNKYDYDWEAAGCKGWSHSQVLPYFIQSEANINTRYLKSGYHGRNGSMIVSDVNLTPVSAAFLSAGRELEFPTTDLNGEFQLGQMNAQGTLRRGARWGALHAFLHPAMQRPNLHLYVNAHATKIVFNGNRAIGVQFHHNGSNAVAKSRREIVVSAGVIESPKLLMLSGIGPKEHLSRMGISVVKNNPGVGQNLQDHVCTDAVAFLTDKGSSVTKERSRSMKALVDYFLFGKGVMSSPAGYEAFGLYQTFSASKAPPQIQLSAVSTQFGEKNPTDYGSYRTKLGYNKKVFRELWGDLTGADGMMLIPTLLHPMSRGHVMLRSSNPFDTPLIQPNYLNNSVDVEVLLSGIRLAQRFGKTEAFQRVGARQLKRVHPNCTTHKYDSDAYWRCFIRENTLTAHSAAGTCRMGAVDDESAVVDFKFRVRGVRALRVVDASIMPNLTSGGIHAPVVMFAERAADWMLSITPPEKIVRPYQGLRDEL